MPGTRTGLSHPRLRAPARMRSLPDLPCLSVKSVRGALGFLNTIKTCLLGLEIFLDQLLSAVKATESVDSVLVLLADLLLLAHRLFLLPCELAVC